MGAKMRVRSGAFLFVCSVLLLLVGCPRAAIDSQGSDDGPAPAVDNGPEAADEGPSTTDEGPATTDIPGSGDNGPPEPCPAGSDGTPCDDGAYCTVDDKCALGQCVGQERNCGDDLPCSVDTCSNAAAACQHDLEPCPCLADSDCTDDDPCTGTESCDKAANTCVNGVSVDCSALDGPCKLGQCVDVGGAAKCEPKLSPEGTGCDDGDLCTVGDECHDGACVSGDPVECEDYGPCTKESTCDPGSGECSEIPEPFTVACDDSLKCTTGDHCDGLGNCTGTPATCDDGNECTVDSCSKTTGSCVFADASVGAACTSAIPCPDNGNGCAFGWCVCACVGYSSLTLSVEGAASTTLGGPITLTSAAGDSLKLECPMDWVSAAGPLLAGKDTQLTWHRPCQPEDGLWTLFQQGDGNKWNALFSGASKSGTITLASPDGEIASWSVLQLLVLDYGPVESKCTDYQTVVMNLNSNPAQRLSIEIEGVTQSRIGRFRLTNLTGKGDSPWIETIDDWSGSYLPAGSNKSGTIEVVNPCGTPGERFYFGDEYVETWYQANAGSQTTKSGSLILRDDSGNEVQRLNFFQITPKSYVPGYDECTSEEAITYGSTKIENG